MNATSRPQSAATIGVAAELAPRLKLLRSWVGSCVMSGDFVLHHIGPDQHGRPLDHGNGEKQHDQHAERQCDGDRTLTAALFLRLGEDDPFRLCLSAIASPCAPYQINGATARTTTSSSKVANSANRYRIENANSFRVARDASTPSRRR